MTPVVHAADGSRGEGTFLPVHIQPKWLPPALADALVGYAIDSEARFRVGTILHSGKIMVDEGIRQTLVLDDIGPFQYPLAEAALAFKPTLETLFGIPPFAASSVEIEMAAHGDGAHFRHHIDTCVVVNKRANPRVLTLVLYLHGPIRRFSGGALRMHALGSSAVRDIAPMHNRLVAFPSIAPHSVQPIACSSRAFADRRFAVNIWIHR